LCCLLTIPRLLLGLLLLGLLELRRLRWRCRHELLLGLLELLLGLLELRLGLLELLLGLLELLELRLGLLELRLGLLNDVLHSLLRLGLGLLHDILHLLLRLNRLLHDIPHLLLRLGHELHLGLLLDDVLDLLRLRLRLRLRLLDDILHLGLLHWLCHVLNHLRLLHWHWHWHRLSPWHHDRHGFGSIFFHVHNLLLWHGLCGDLLSSSTTICRPGQVHFKEFAVLFLEPQANSCSSRSRNLVPQSVQRKPVDIFSIHQQQSIPRLNLLALVRRATWDEMLHIDANSSRLRIHVFPKLNAYPTQLLVIRHGSEYRLRANDGDHDSCLHGIRIRVWPRRREELFGGHGILLLILLKFLENHALWRLLRIKLLSILIRVVVGLHSQSSRWLRHSLLL